MFYIMGHQLCVLQGVRSHSLALERPLKMLCGRSPRSFSGEQNWAVVKQKDRDRLILKK